MKNYVLGILGGLVGGLITAVPWVLMYVYGGYILSILAMFIAVGFIFCYRKCKGPITKATPWIVGVSSILIVVFVTLVAIPLLSLANEGFPATLQNLQILYASSDYMGALTKDLIISIIFTFLGIGGVLSKLKQEALAGKEATVKEKKSKTKKED